jgi:hypothetical protein
MYVYRHTASSLGILQCRTITRRKRRKKFMTHGSFVRHPTFARGSTGRGGVCSSWAPAKNSRPPGTTHLEKPFGRELERNKIPLIRTSNNPRQARRGTHRGQVTSGQSYITEALRDRPDHHHAMEVSDNQFSLSTAALGKAEFGGRGSKMWLPLF